MSQGRSIIRWETRSENKSYSLGSSPISSVSLESNLDKAGQGKDILFMYLDESGNFDFSDKGTKYFMMTCVLTKRPFSTCHELLDLRYDLMENGVEASEFHACDDKPEIKSKVYNIISRKADKYDAYVFYVDKSKLPENMQDAAVLYSSTFSWIVSKVYDEAHLENCSRVVVVTDELPKDAVKKEVSKPLKTSMKKTFQDRGIPYTLMHHRSESDLNLQVVDYICWAYKRFLCDGREWPYKVISNVFASFGDFHESVGGMKEGA